MCGNTFRTFGGWLPWLLGSSQRRETGALRRWRRSALHARRRRMWGCDLLSAGIELFSAACCMTVRGIKSLLRIGTAPFLLRCLGSPPSRYAAAPAAPAEEGQSKKTKRRNRVCTTRGASSAACWCSCTARRACRELPGPVTAS